MNLLWDDFEWFCFQISNDTKYFFSRPRHGDQGLIVGVVFYLQIWNKKQHIIISRVISGHMGPMYIETSSLSIYLSIYIYIYIYIYIVHVNFLFFWSIFVCCHTTYLTVRRTCCGINSCYLSSHISYFIFALCPFFFFFFFYWNSLCISLSTNIICLS